MLEIGIPQPSQYLRVTWMLSAETVLKFPDSSSVRFFGEGEADSLAKKTRKRNVFARHSWENNFYLQRIGELSGHTVIEVFRPGDPQDMGLNHRSSIDKGSKLRGESGSGQPELKKSSISSDRGKFKCK